MKFISRWVEFMMILLCGIALVGCTSPVDYRKKAFADLLDDCRMENKCLFLYLYNEHCPACERADKGLASATLAKVLNERFVCTKKNVTDEFWLSQVFYAASTPTFVILDEEGKILYMQTGFMMEAALEQTLTDIAGQKRPVYPVYPSSLYTSGEKLYELFEPVLNAWLLQNFSDRPTEKRQQVKKLLEKSIAIEPYFMNQYLLYKWYTEEGDTIRQQEVAAQLLGQVNRTDHLLYGEWINEILQIDTTQTLLPVIQVKNKTIRVNDLQANRQKKVVVPFTNVGNAPLLIRSIDISCGCLKGYWDKHPVLPQTADSIGFIITPTAKGRFMKRAAIASNAKELTILTFIGDVK